MMHRHLWRIVPYLLLLSWAGAGLAAGLTDTVRQVKRGIVAVGTVHPLRQPPAYYLGTGFAVGSGNFVITNAHVLPSPADREREGQLTVFVGGGRDPELRRATLVLKDQRHDLALLSISGKPLPALVFGDSDAVAEGQAVAFTGFPIGMVLGVYPVTHQGIVSAISPIAIPANHSGGLDAVTIKRLRDSYDVFQLDATAYPGNSGSPLYDPATGRVLGVLNMVFVKQSKENILKDPSGIAYAIPGRYARELVAKGAGR